MDNKIWEAYGFKIKNKLYGLLCEFEKGRDWEKFLDNILIELMGYDESQKTIYYYMIFYKLSSLRYLRYEYFRSTIFECISLFDKVPKWSDDNEL